MSEKTAKSDKKKYTFRLVPFGTFTTIWLVLMATGNCSECGGDKDYVEMALSSEDCIGTTKE